MASQKSRCQTHSFMNRQLLTILLLSTFIALLGIGIIVPILPVFATTLGANSLALGMIIAAFSISRGLLQPVVGNLSDRWGRKGFLACGLLIYCLVGMILPLAHSVSNILAIRLLHGVGSAMIVPVAMAYVSDMAPIGQEGRYMGMLNIAIFSGIGGGPLLGGFFTDHWGMASAFYAMSGLSIVAFLLVISQLPTQDITEPKIPRPSTIRSLGIMFATRRTRGILLARMTTMIVMVPAMAFTPLLLSQWFNSSGTQTGIVIAGRTLANAILQTPFGRMSERRDKVTMLQTGCIIISLAICLVPMTTSFWPILILFIILGVGEAMIWPVLGALATEEGRRYGQGTMMGAFNTAMSAGIFLGAVGAGICSDLIGLGWSFFVIGVTVLISSLLATRLIRAG
ncbi:MAG: MFS transporter [Proteobacteria bacterium]|nr:MFS transporter [Desulfobulbaceae bacterium]MBU4154301.1 MFS transporter [Pseudomonadota bacterium]